MLLSLPDVRKERRSMISSLSVLAETNSADFGGRVRTCSPRKQNTEATTSLRAVARMSNVLSIAQAVGLSYRLQEKKPPNGNEWSSSDVLTFFMIRFKKTLNTGNFRTTKMSSYPSYWEPVKRSTSFHERKRWVYSVDNWSSETKWRYLSFTQARRVYRW